MEKISQKSFIQFPEKWAYMTSTLDSNSKILRSHQLRNGYLGGHKNTGITEYQLNDYYSTGTYVSSLNSDIR